MKISIIYGTARGDYPIIDLPHTHQFTPFLDSLELQTFKDFEVVISDAMYNDRNYDFSKYSFPIKHIDPTEFSWARKLNLWGLQDGFNYGAINADGELLLWFGDCCELPNINSLQIWWDWYQKGYFAHALVIYYKGNKPHYVEDVLNDTNSNIPLDKLKILVNEGSIKDIIRDSRWKFVEESENGIFYCGGDTFYGYSSTSLDAALKVNGYDSNFDGSKSLGDVEMGLRLGRAGYKFVCDKRLYIIERKHEDNLCDVLSEMSLSHNEFRCNYSLMLLNKQKGRITGNDYKLTLEELECIIERGTKWSVHRPEVGTHEYNLLMHWFNNQPIFNINQLRQERLKKEVTDPAHQ